MNREPEWEPTFKGKLFGAAMISGMLGALSGLAAALIVVVEYDWVGITAFWAMVGIGAFVGVFLFGLFTLAIMMQK